MDKRRPVTGKEFAQGVVDALNRHTSSPKFLANSARIEAEAAARLSARKSMAGASEEEIEAAVAAATSHLAPYTKD